mmetsp:Transcript_32956/g.60680  ORF Transcript_32956/g.60680 Transcript_32956/m.60680 type:complete len:565 (+) Transcript_32956:163-1857(+)
MSDLNPVLQQLAKNLIAQKQLQALATVAQSLQTLQAAGLPQPAAGLPGVALPSLQSLTAAAVAQQPGGAPLPVAAASPAPLPPSLSLTLPAMGAGTGGSAAALASSSAGASSSSTSGASSASSAPGKPRGQELSSVEEVPRCHLHRKTNKACKYCKAYANFQELRSKEIEERKSAALERLKEGSTAKAGARLGQDDLVPLPNFVHFPPVLKDRILNHKFYKITSINQEVAEVKETLFDCDTVEPETRGASSLDVVPSDFICSVYRLLSIKLTEGQLQGLLNNRSLWVRCAGFLYVRFGVHQDRYWELLSDALMDPEEFVPSPSRSNETMTEGEYVEQLLSKEKYYDFKLPRIEAAMRRTINEQMVVYHQFRKRYLANLEHLERFQDPDEGIPVEVCTNGEWSVAVTAGSASPGRRRVTVPVQFPSGEERNVSLGMLILQEGGSSSGDLTRSRGRSHQELLAEYRDKQRGAAVANGKDYCKTSGRHMVHAGGMVFIGGGKRSRKEDEEDSEEERRAQQAKRSSASREHEVKMAAIMEKYCARASSARTTAQSGDGVDAPDRLRLG